jgi:hypothetical protein
LFNAKKSKAFGQFLRQTGARVLAVTEVPEWQFTGTALDYFLKIRYHPDL